MTYDYRAAREGIFAMRRDAANLHERVLLLVLVEFAPNIEPSTARLADMLGADERTVRRLIRSCESKGLLLVEPRPGQRSRYTLADPGQFARPDVLVPRAECPPTPGKVSAPPRAECPPKQTSKADKKADKRESGRKTRRKTRRKTWKRIPCSWRPSDGCRSLAQELGVDFDSEIAKLRDHEFKTARSDADATCRNWLRQAAQYQKQNAKRTGPKQPNGGTWKPQIAAE